MTVKIEKNELVIRIPLQEPKASASGKNMVIASTNGNYKSDCLYKGKAITIGVNAYYKPE